MKPTALLLAGNHPALMAAITTYAALALCYSLTQWRYADRFRRRLTKGELSSRRRARRAPARQAHPVDILVPCYREAPALFEACCLALERQRQRYPGRTHVWLVDDGSPNKAGLGPVYERFAALPGWTVIHHPRNLGKRRAQDSAFRRGDGTYVVTVDSDTVLRADCVARLVAAMDRNPRAGAVSGHVGALNARTNWLTRLVDWRYQFLFRQERAAQSWDGAVTCCSGPVSIYRRKALARIWKSYVEDTFLGRQRQFGDDLKLTLLVLEQGYESHYEPSAKALTSVPETLGAYARQQVRWNKSFYRELLRAYGIAHRRKGAPRPGRLGPRCFARLEQVARLLVPLLAPCLLAACVWVALSDGDRLPLLAMAVVSLLHAAVIGLQSRSWTFPALYVPLSLVLLTLVRLNALVTLADSRWGTRDRQRRWRVAWRT